MMNYFRTNLLMFFCLLSSMAFAQKQTSIEFTAEEIQRHRMNASLISREAANCIEGIKKTHEDFYAQYGFSKFYGNRISPAPSAQKRFEVIKSATYVNQSQVKKMSTAELKNAVEKMESTACITMALKCLGEGFNKAGDNETWQKIYTYVGRNKNWFGHELQQALMDLGWKSMYWNPDPSQNSTWDKEDQTLNPLADGKKWNPVWGAHQIIYRQVMNKGTYGSTTLRVDDKNTLVGFKQNVPATFKNVPFFIGIAHQGYHVFPGTFGYVIEAHSLRPIGAHENIEYAPFNPLRGALSLADDGGGPRWSRTEWYRSGLIVVPPSN